MTIHPWASRFVHLLARTSLLALIAFPLLLGTSQAAYKLPIEVFAIEYGNSGTEEVSRLINISNTAHSVYMRLHGASYENKVRFKVEGVNGTTYSATGYRAIRNNSNVTVLHEAAAELGGVGGAFSVIDLVYDFPAGERPPAGQYRITFEAKLRSRDPDSMGYRVVDLDLLNGAGDSLSASQKSEDLDLGVVSGGNANTGKSLWETASLLVRPPTQGGSPQTMIAKCADCHFKSGYDLNYFGFSNHSIIRRSEFHGLSEQQGKHIAAYIRSLESGTPHGRPWNPPFQPGDRGPDPTGEKWMAGAGFDAVLFSDAEGQAELPGGGIDARLLMPDDRIASVPKQEIRIALQYPDWNSWLPKIHPRDAFVSAHRSKLNVGYNGSRNSVLEKIILGIDAIEDNLDINSPLDLDYLYGEMRDDMDEAGDISGGPSSDFVLDMFLYTQGSTTASGGADLDDPDGFANTNNGNYGNPANHPTPNPEWAQDFYSFGQWTAIRKLDVVFSNGIETLGQAFYGVNGRPLHFFTDRQIFNLSPDRLRLMDDGPLIGDLDPNNDGLGDFTQSEWDHGRRMNMYLANVWYEVQMTLNSGARNSASVGFGTVDWEYVAQRFKQLGDYSTSRNYIMPYRMSAFILTAMEQGDSGYGAAGTGAGDPNKAWDTRDNTATMFGFHQNESANELSGMDGDVITTLFQVWLEKNAQFSRDDWRLLTDSGYTGRLSSFPSTTNYNPNALPGDPDGNTSTEPAKIAETITTLTARGDVPPAILNGLSDFGRFGWPGTNNANVNNTVFPIIRTGNAGTGTPTVTSDGQRLRVEWDRNANAVSYNVQRRVVDSPAETWRSCRFFQSATSAAKQVFFDHAVRPGVSYQYRITSNFSNGNESQGSSVSAAASLTSDLLAGWIFDDPAPASGIFPNVVPGGPTAALMNATASNDRARSVLPRGCVDLGTPADSAAFVRPFLALSGTLHDALSSNVSVSFWVKVTSTPSGDALDQGAVIGARTQDFVTGNPVKSQYSLWGLIGPDRRIGYAVGNEDASPAQPARIVWSNTALGLDGWNHVTITRQASNGQVKIYLNGTLSRDSSTLPLNQRPWAGVLRAPLAYTLGRNDGSFVSFPGIIDEVFIHNKVLSDAEVSTLYSTHKGRP